MILFESSLPKIPPSTTNFSHRILFLCWAVETPFQGEFDNPSSKFWVFEKVLRQWFLQKVRVEGKATVLFLKPRYNIVKHIWPWVWVRKKLLIRCCTGKSFFFSMQLITFFLLRLTKRNATSKNRRRNETSFWILLCFLSQAKGELSTILEAVMKVTNCFCSTCDCLWNNLMQLLKLNNFSLRRNFFTSKFPIC